MRRQIQRKPIRVSRQVILHDKEQVSSPAVKMQDIVGVFSSLSGLMVAMLWLAGRYYTAAYFGAMNIPFSQISYSIWEYAGAAGPKLFYIFLAKFYLPLTIFATALCSILLATFVMQALFPQLRLMDAMRDMTAQTIHFSRRFRTLVTVALILYMVYFLMLATIEFSESGFQAGQQTVLTQSYGVEVYSRDVIPLGSSPVSHKEQAGFNHYRGLRLLTHNNGKYYLFREIDRESCRPKQVFVIPDTENIYVVVKEIMPVRTPCTTATDGE